MIINNNWNDKGFCDDATLACKSDLTVLITGETGSGKTTLAEKIHHSSARKDGPFVSINVASLNEGLIESELFGSEKGAFTGASHFRRGKLESANGGTLFLDEIGELPSYLQVKFLDFLQNKKIYRVGSDKLVGIDVRIIAATHQNLDQLKLQKKMREDFYFRLEQIHIHLPSLKECKDDLDSIVHNILEDLMVKYDKKFTKISEKYAEIIENYNWPGNYRELRSVLEYSVLSSSGSKLFESSFPEWFLKRVSENLNQNIFDEDLVVKKKKYKNALYEFEKIFFENALLEGFGNMTFAAEKVGMNKTTFLRKINELKLNLRASEIKNRFRLD